MQQHTGPILTVSIRNLVIAYDSVVALRQDTLDLQGQIIAVIGHNGAGKSTLLKAILGLFPLQRGTLNTKFTLEGASTALRPDKHMAFCPETGAVFADISVEAYIKLWCRVKQNDSTYYWRGGSDIIELLNIPPLFGKLGRELSKGQRRRVQTAIGFLTNPRLFLFDEPFDGLDVLRSSELTELIQARSSTTTFMISSHRMDVMERLADQAIVLREGSIVASGDIPSVSTTLAGRSIALSGLSDTQVIFHHLRDSLPDFTVSPVGTQLIITGVGMESDSIAAILHAHNERSFTMTEITPSLGDAMTYHLMEMRRVGRN